MIIRLLLGAVLIVAILMLFRRAFPNTQNIRKITITLVIVVAVIVLIALGATGRLHWLMSVAGVALIAMPKLLSVLRYVAPIQQAYVKMKDTKNTPPGSSSSLSVGEAFSVLGLSPEASREDVIQAHRKLMQKNHPDRGGSDYLAHTINQAKEVLLQSYDDR